MRRAGPSSHSHEFALLLAVPFTAPGVGEWWDNNSGNNFRAATTMACKRPGCYYHGLHTLVTEAEYGACTYSGDELVVAGGITDDMRGEN